MYSFTALVLVILSVAKANIGDFRIGVQMCDGLWGQHAGEIRYTPYLLQDIIQNGEDGWSVWASDYNYGNPDGIRLGLFGQMSGSAEPLEIAGYDLRMCIQLTDRSTNELGNYQKEGVIRCTPWVSDGGGWSEWAADNNWSNYDAVRVGIEAKADPSLSFGDIQIGIRGTDKRDSAKLMGQPQYTPWLTYMNEESYAWSHYASDSRFSNPDAYKIFIKAGTNYCPNGETAQSVALSAQAQPGSLNEFNHFKESPKTNDFVVYAAVGFFVVNVIVLVAVSWKGSKKEIHDFDI